MPRLIIALIRHGEYQQPTGIPSAHLPYPLTVSGKNQAREAAKILAAVSKTEHWKINPVIDSSQLQRAWQTAAIIADEVERHEKTSMNVESYDQLAERCLGSAANLTVNEIEAIIEKDPRYQPLPSGWKSDSYFKLPFQGAESLMQAGEHVMQHVTQKTESLLQNMSTDTLKIFVGHGAAFRHAAVHLGILSTDQAVSLSMYHCHPVFFERVNKNKWQHIAGEWKIRQVHDSNHD